MDTPTLIAQIKREFSRAARPAEYLFRTMNAPRSYEGNVIAKAFDGRLGVDGVSLPEEVMGRRVCFHAIPSFMTDAGLAYFLPGLLILCISEADKYFDLLESVCFACAPHPLGRGRLDFKIFTPGQASSLRDVFLKIYDDEKIEAAAVIADALDRSNIDR